MHSYENIETDEGRNTIERQFEQEFQSLSAFTTDDKLFPRIILYVCLFALGAISLIFWAAWRYESVL